MSGQILCICWYDTFRMSCLTHWCAHCLAISALCLRLSRQTKSYTAMSMHHRVGHHNPRNSWLEQIHEHPGKIRGVHGFAPADLFHKAVIRGHEAVLQHMLVATCWWWWWWWLDNSGDLGKPGKWSLKWLHVCLLAMWCLILRARSKCSRGRLLAVSSLRHWYMLA